MSVIPIIGLIGAKRSGKDTVAARLTEAHDFERAAFADALKETMYDLNPLIADGGLRLADYVDSIGWEAAKSKPEVRRLLQAHGVAIRTHVGEYVWTDVIHDRLTEARMRGTRLVITDVRFPNEVGLVESFGGIIARVERPGLTRDAADAHISERALDGYTPHLVIVNDSTIEALYRAVDRAVGESEALVADARTPVYTASEYA